VCALNCSASPEFGKAVEAMETVATGGRKAATINYSTIPGEPKVCRRMKQSVLIIFQFRMNKIFNVNF